jgi:uncharacterized SAM-binding protein YcdF (DUF218 family)
MSQLMDEKMAQRSAQSAQWQERLLKAYRSAKTRTLKALAVFLAAYLFVFYTPLVWFLAKPLRVTQPPERSDCILVFAGGTGESGKAGQGYEERVQFAVELYKKAVAKNIVFSSGYSYVFKEPAVMKALAVSLGVPEQAILLEEKAVNTYENIKFSRALIKKKGWHTVVIVSSPYHLRRVKLVAEKIAADLRINYAPIPHSLFFAHPLRDEQGRLILRRIKPYQAKAILHEYAAIIYYWIKGYI